MYLSKTDIKSLRYQVELGGGFQVALVPMQSHAFLNVKIAIDTLYKALTDKGLRVLVDDRDAKPKDKFEVIDFLKIRHRIVISSRSISAGVFEYKDLKTNYFEKIQEDSAVDYLLNTVSNPSVSK